MVTRNGVHSCHIIGLFVAPEDAVRVAVSGIEGEHDAYHDYRVVAIDIGVTRDYENAGAEFELTRADQYGRRLKTNPITAELYCPPGESIVARYLPSDMKVIREEFLSW